MMQPVTLKHSSLICCVGQSPHPGLCFGWSYNAGVQAHLDTQFVTSSVNYCCCRHACEGLEGFAEGVLHGESDRGQALRGLA